MRACGWVRVGEVEASPKPCCSPTVGSQGASASVNNDERTATLYCITVALAMRDCGRWPGRVTLRICCYVAGEWTAGSCSGHSCARTQPRVQGWVTFFHKVPALPNLQLSGKRSRSVRRGTGASCLTSHRGGRTVLHRQLRLAEVYVFICVQLAAPC